MSRRQRFQHWPEALWRRYTQVYADRGTSSLALGRLVWCSLCIGGGLLFLLLLAVAWPPLAPSPFWIPLHGVRGVLLVALGLWVVLANPWRATTALERRQGQAIATLCLLFIGLSSAIYLHDESLWRFPLLHTVFWGAIVLLFTQLYWLARRGLVRQSAAILILALLTFQLGNAGDDVALTLRANPFLYTIVVLCCGLFVRWWVGVAVGFALPLAVTAMQASGLTQAAPNWNAAITATLMLTGIAAIVAFYAWSLEAVINQAETGQVALADANDQLNYALHEARSANALKTQIVATVSHELRTPLTTIMGHTDMLRSGLYGDLNEDQQHAADRSYVSSERLLRLINDLLDFSRLDTNSLHLHPEEMPLLSTIYDVVSLVQPGAELKGLTFTTTLDPALPPTLVCDPLRLRQVLLNLLENAVRYTERGAVTLAVRPMAGDAGQAQPADHIIFSISDTGIGIPPQDQALIFEPFRRSSANPPAVGGSGLGLAIVKQLVQAMGGTVGVVSTVGQGSTFTVTLPLVAGEE
ncbi:MAG: HAMP domain-containing histidine kinase [Chloroflexaceae bacterium]|nr:HAMP domain-containing histidine kinase [Chloroflexaceae bacterium]